MATVIVWGAGMNTPGIKVGPLELLNNLMVAGAGLPKLNFMEWEIVWFVIPSCFIWALGTRLTHLCFLKKTTLWSSSGYQVHEQCSKD